MWRIAGLLFFNDKDHFADKSQKAFRKERIIDFLNEKGIALFDTATAVRRLQDNASDKYLEVVRPTDISHYCTNCHSAKRLSLRDKKPPTRSVRCSHCKNLKSAILQNSFSQTPYAALPHALFIKSLSAGSRKKSGSLSHYVSGPTNVISHFFKKIKQQRTCRFESFHYLCSRKHGSSSVGRAPVSKTGCREFEPLLPCNDKKL